MKIFSVLSVALCLLTQISSFVAAQEVPAGHVQHGLLSAEDYVLVGEILVHDDRFDCMTNTSRVSSAHYLERPKSFHKGKRSWGVSPEDQLQANVVLEDGPMSYSAVVDLKAKTVLACDRKDTAAVFVPKETKKIPLLGSLVLIKEGIHLFGIQLPSLEIPLMHAGVAVVFFILGLSSEK